MTVILKDTVPPVTEIAKLGYAAVAVYSLMYQSAYQDLRVDKRKYRKWQDRRDCGGQPIGLTRLLPKLYTWEKPK